MNQGKIWLVVKPTVGLPAFLGGVAIIALAVHAAVLTKTDWYPAYYSGNKKVKTAEAAPTPQVVASNTAVADVKASPPKTQ